MLASPADDEGTGLLASPNESEGPGLLASPDDDEGPRLLASTTCCKDDDEDDNCGCELVPFLAFKSSSALLVRDDDFTAGADSDDNGWGDEEDGNDSMGVTGASGLVGTGLTL